MSVEYAEFDGVAQSMIDSLELVKNMPPWQDRALALEAKLYAAMDAVTLATAQARQGETIAALVRLRDATLAFAKVSDDVRELLETIVGAMR